MKSATKRSQQPPHSECATSSGETHFGYERCDQWWNRPSMITVGLTWDELSDIFPTTAPSTRRNSPLRFFSPIGRLTTTSSVLRNHTQLADRASIFAIQLFYNCFLLKCMSDL